MKNPRYIIELFCDIDGTKVGEAKSLIPMTMQEYRNQAGFVDLRCDNCNQTHGRFADLTREFIEKTGDTPADAEAFVKTNRKRSDFNRELTKEIDKRNRKKRDIINE